MNSTVERVTNTVSEQRAGELMETLLRDRHRFGSDEEFRAHAISAVRRFITDLRRLDIEIALRPNHYDHQRTLS